jgi:hypothetical protein
MGLLERIYALAVVAALVVLAGCYAPSLRDCAVSCAGPADCAPAQVCGDDGLCAAPEVAGHCAMTSVDAGRMPDAAPPLPRDAAPPRDSAPPVDAAEPDAPLVVKLHVQIEGKGSVVVDGRGTCSSTDPSHGNCMYDIALGVAQRVQATEIDPMQSFLGWTSITCAGQGPTCTFTPPVAVTIVAKFGKKN